jgi:choline dehydrogenase-like flavoprotein
MGETFDYIIVGAGAAGCVLANRLSADRRTTVLLLEAGGNDRSPLLTIPAGFSRVMGTKYNWLFTTAPQRHMNGRRMFLPQGKVLGGSTSINAMLYIRGNRLDYDEWRDLGNDGWGYDDVLPYFKRSEHNQRFNNEYHGSDGELGVSDQLEINPLTHAFVRAAQQAGLRFTADPNGAAQDGVYFNQLTQSGGARSSASKAFLTPIVGSRHNLTVLTGAHVVRVNVEGGMATGVDYVRGDARQTAVARKETIVAAGPINSPHLLMVSGIGPGTELQAVGVTVVHDLPGVGKNLHDQLEVNITSSINVPLSYDRQDRYWNAARHALQWLIYRRGPATATVSQGGAFIRTNDQVRSPDIQVHMEPAYVVWSEGASKKIQRVPGHGITLISVNVRPTSRGAITLTSPRIEDFPDIDPNYLSDEHDLATSTAGFREIRKILAQPELARYVIAEQNPGASVRSDDEIAAFIRQYGVTDFHPVGTCRMGADPLAVVDARLRVHGIGRLRVIDSSIMPKIISGNTQAATFMIGEKGADMVLADAARG